MTVKYTCETTFTLLIPLLNMSKLINTLKNINDDTKLTVHGYTRRIETKYTLWTTVPMMIIALVIIYFDRIFEDCEVLTQQVTMGVTEAMNYYAKKGYIPFIPTPDAQCDVDFLAYHPINGTIKHKCSSSAICDFFLSNV